MHNNNKVSFTEICIKKIHEMLSMCINLGEGEINMSTLIESTAAVQCTMKHGRTSAFFMKKGIN